MAKSHARLILFLLFVGISGIAGNEGFYWPAAQEGSSIMEWSVKPHQLWCGPNAAERTYPPSDYKLIPNLGYYKFYSFGASWDVARTVCNEDGASLVIVNSEKEATVLGELKAANPGCTGALDCVHVWTGIHERGENGKFYSVDGEPIINIGFWKWNTGEPGDAGLDDAVLFSGTTKQLADAPSINKYTFACEIEVSQIEPRRKWFELKRLTQAGDPRSF